MYINVFLFILLSNMGILMRKSIHICFSLKKGRSDTASYPKDMIVLCRYIKLNGN